VIGRRRLAGQGKKMSSVEELALNREDQSGWFISPYASCPARLTLTRLYRFIMLLLY